MASGLPDYYNGVDVTYQTLAEIINRPKYGAGQRSTAAVAVDASAETTLITITGKGMVVFSTSMTATGG